jgi:hypothetical protein
VIQVDDGVTITRGKHVFKTGFQMWRFRLNTFYSGNSGEYGSILFGGAFTGDPASDFFTGYPGATGKGVSTGGTWHQFSTRFAGYGQDDWPGQSRPRDRATRARRAKRQQPRAL